MDLYTALEATLLIEFPFIEHDFTQSTTIRSEVRHSSKLTVTNSP